MLRTTCLTHQQCHIRNIRQISHLFSTSTHIMRTLSSQLPLLQDGYVRIYLCRHGETDYNNQGILQGRGVNAQLNATGRKQAQMLAKSMKDIPLKAVYSSSLARAMETAQYVSHTHPQSKRGDFRDLEEMSFGELEGTPRSQCEAFLQDVHAKWKAGIYDESAAFPKGECPAQVEKRGTRTIHDLVSLGNDDHIAIVCHGRFNKIILASLLSPNKSLYGLTSIPQDNTCVNVLDYNRSTGEYAAVLINGTKHLKH